MRFNYRINKKNYVKLFRFNQRRRVWWQTRILWSR